ncbi:MAG: branched-chain amino acid ABC transporter permease [Thermodesulfobacteriota bacterium]
MSAVWKPCGFYHETYGADQGWWQTPLLRVKLFLLLVTVFVVIPLLGEYPVSLAIQIGYYSMAALGVQLLIGYTGLITLGHAAFMAVGAYTSTLLILQFPWPAAIVATGLAYPLSILAAGIVAGLWCVLFGLPCAKVKGFYLILTTMAAQFITVDLILTQYVSQIGGRGQAFQVPPELIKIGPVIFDSEVKIYYLMAGLATLMVIAFANLLRTRTGRAWVAIRDNDIAAMAMGINIYRYKLLAFFVAGFMGGVAGAFWVSNTSALSPEHFPWFLSLYLVGVILIGGVGSIHGAFFGSIFMVLVIEFLQNVAMGVADFYPKFLVDFAYIKEMIFGLAICAFLIFEPNGISYRWWQIKNYFNLWPFSY